MKQRVMILSAAAYAVTDEKTGVLNEGISMQYVDTEDLSPCVSENGLLGYKVMKGSVPLKYMKEFKEVPGLYDVDFKMAVYKDRTVLKPASVLHV